MSVWPPFPRVPSREFRVSKNTPAGEIAGNFAKLRRAGVHAAPVAPAHARWRHFSILQTILRLDLDGKMARLAPTDGHHARLLRRLDHRLAGRDPLQEWAPAGACPRAGQRPDPWADAGEGRGGGAGAFNASNRAKRQSAVR